MINGSGHSDNCIVFGEDIAEIYDITRPFLKSDTDHRTFTAVCKMLLDRFIDKHSIRMLDVGAGTGRLALAIARHYDHLLIDKNATGPKLIITCLDRSEPMLSRLRIKADECSFRFVEVVPRSGDARDINNYGERFHVAFAHWIFHVIYDWRVAVLAMDRVLDPDGLVFLCKEQSDLYEAVDGNLDRLRKSSPEARFWSSFFQGRAEIIRDTFPEFKGLSPQLRLGSRVVDNSVQKIFMALGWSKPVRVDRVASWTSDFTIRDLIERIVRPRAFSNMRLFGQEDELKQRFESLAERLKLDYSKILNYTWRVKTHFEIRVSDRQSPFPIKSANLILDTAKQTIGRRWHKLLNPVFNRDTFWQRLVRETWDRLHMGAEEVTPFGGTDLPCNTEVLFAGIFHPALREPKFVRATGGGSLRDASASGMLALWGGLTERADALGPYGFLLTDEDSDPATTTDNNYPMEVLEINPRLRAALERISLSANDRKTEQAHSLLSNSKVVKDFLIQCEDLCATTRHAVEAQLSLLISLSQVIDMEEVRFVYVYPCKAQLMQFGGSTPGLLLLCRQVLDRISLSFISALSDLIFDQYADETDLHTSVQAITQHSQSALVAHKEPIIDATTTSGTPIVIILTTAEQEHDAVEELFGGGHSDDRIRRLGKDYYIKLPYSNFPIWNVRCEQGSSSDEDASQQMINRVLREIGNHPVIVIAVGICFGLKRGDGKQKEGDIIVSRSIQPYEHQRVGKETIKPRAKEKEADRQLFKIFANLKRGWNNGVRFSDKPNIFFGTVLSGEKLSDNPSLVKTLVGMFPEAIAAEMEGTGLAVAARDFPGARWILVKAICDWGYDKYPDNKYHALAAHNATAFVLHVIKSDIFLNFAHSISVE